MSSQVGKGSKISEICSSRENRDLKAFQPLLNPEIVSQGEGIRFSWFVRSNKKTPKFGDWKRKLQSLKFNIPSHAYAELRVRLNREI